MSARTIVVSLLLLAGGVGLAAPAEGQQPYPYPYPGEWITRDEAHDPELDATKAYGLDHGSEISNLFGVDPSITVRVPDTPEHLYLFFEPPVGEPFGPGTFRVHPHDPTATTGQLLLLRGFLMCGEPFWRWTEPGVTSTIASGTVTISEVEISEDRYTFDRLRLTYDIGCQRADGVSGVAGSVLIGAGSADPVPPRPDPLESVGDLAVVNTGPSDDGSTSTSLSWSPAAGSRSTLVDTVVGSDDPADAPGLLGRKAWNPIVADGSVSSYEQTGIAAEDGRVWRVTPVDPRHRLGQPLVVSVSGVRLDLGTAPRSVVAGWPAVVQGRLSTSARGGAAGASGELGLPGARIQLCRWTAGSTDLDDCEVVNESTTGPDGQFLLRDLPGGSTDYGVVVPATPRHLGGLERVTVDVAPETDLRVETPGAGERSTSVRMTSSKARLGAKGTVSLQRLDGSRWRTVATKQLGNGRGRAVFAVQRAPGQQFRAVKPGDRRHVGGVSRVVRLR